VQDFLVGDLFNVKSKGPVSTNFLCCGVSGSFGMRTCMLTMSTIPNSLGGLCHSRTVPTEWELYRELLQILENAVYGCWLLKRMLLSEMSINYAC
jgi:hypothetical protein